MERELTAEGLVLLSLTQILVANLLYNIHYLRTTKVASKISVQKLQASSCVAFLVSIFHCGKLQSNWLRRQVYIRCVSYIILLFITYKGIYMYLYLIFNFFIQLYMHLNLVHPTITNTLIYPDTNN